MKRVDLIRHLEQHGCEFLREGGEHTVYVNRTARRSSSIPRHREVNDFLARKICDDLQGPASKVGRLCHFSTSKPLVIQYGLDVSALYAAGITRALVHSTAQRFARVRVAEMQLYQAAQVKSGRDRRDLYGALAPAIDAARGAFRERFLLPLYGIPDYLHQELVKTLAKEDAVLLGPSYPGPQA